MSNWVLKNYLQFVNKATFQQYKILTLLDVHFPPLGLSFGCVKDLQNINNVFRGNPYIWSFLANRLLKKQTLDTRTMWTFCPINWPFSAKKMKEVDVAKLNPNWKVVRCPSITWVNKSCCQAQWIIDCFFYTWISANLLEELCFQLCPDFLITM